MTDREALERELREYLSSERAANGWRNELRTALHRNELATQTVGRNLAALTQRFEEHRAEESEFQRLILAHSDGQREWRRRVNKRMSELGDDWDATTGQYALDVLNEELAERRESSRARKADGRRTKWWVLGLVGFLLTNLTTALVSHYTGQPTRPQHEQPAK